MQTIDPARDEPSLANELARRRHSFTYGYIPPARLVVDPSLEFHQDVAASVDVVVEEVVRSKLWNLNADHGDTIRRVSGSNIVVEGYDFNCAITTELGDAVTLSPYSMFFAGFADEVIKWTLEHRSMNVGIRDGDCFLQDDPWVGSNHQLDTAVYSPVFVDGALYAWVFNCAHQRELGGAQPGGLVQNAVDVHTEPTFMPPIKLAEGGVIREDVVDAWTRRSRLPELMTLELNSQIAGVNMARRRLLEIIDRYGATTVKAVMQKMIDDTARAVGERLAQLPDAQWHDERYVAGAREGDHALYRLCMAFEKVGDRLRVTNAGTDPAVGSFNTAPGVFRAAVLNGLLPSLAYDQYLCAAGVLRQLDIDYQPGAITSASHPSAVSTSMGSLMAINQAHALGAKMLSGRASLAEHAFATSSGHSLSNNSVFGTDQHGKPYSDALLDTLAGGIGAFNHRDGIDFGGRITGVGGRFADVERFEQVVPFLYLYRRELPDSGGHGRWRGGVTLASAWVGHKTEHSFIGSGGLLKSVTTGFGIAGGYPSTAGHHWHATDCDVRAWFASGRIPGGPAELREAAPRGGLAPPKKYDNRLGVHDVFELVANPGAGWGDPLDRPLRAVQDDLRDGRVGVQDARDVYGVVVRDDGLVDDAASTAARDDRRRARLAAARAAREPRDRRVSVPDGATCVIEGVALLDGELACARCGRVLGSGSGGYRRGCAELELELPAISPLFT
ncbi:MAG TPA: hydantoinase B/oxoprolinase family protein, partial [Acidimicrobiales bacterium]|nr:hydantoinase B/oxoprolinase family protein [Acidimicrobiales bacterium]